ncbi:hypothetical protein [Sorangium sp. So ce124]|uniref:hypothetical protein n=1 Tax=Sorangium sp. So ce124 TaxID=3133280 RepID=UPI003F63F277
MASVVDVGGGTHVAFDGLTTEQLLQVGATNVVCASDRLIVGSSRRDALEHVRARRAWWNSTKEWDKAYSSDVHWEPPITLWVSASLHERVNLWRICSWLRHLGFAHHDIFVVDFEPVPPSRAASREVLARPFTCSESVSDHADEVLLDHLGKARPWSRERHENAIFLWESYVDENPVQFVDSCVRGVEGFPELASLWTLLSCFFPRKTAEGSLHLSRFDEHTLALLSIEWKTPLALVANESEMQMNLWHLLSCTGDLFLPRRLGHWADHDSSAAVERAPGPKPPHAGYPMLSEVYRLTERGTRLRDKGLDQLTDAPSLPIAGTEAYSASAPWVLLEDGRLARL